MATNDRDDLDTTEDTPSTAQSRAQEDATNNDLINQLSRVQDNRLDDAEIQQQVGGGDSDGVDANTLQNIHQDSHELESDLLAALTMEGAAQRDDGTIGGDPLAEGGAAPEGIDPTSAQAQPGTGTDQPGAGQPVAPNAAGFALGSAEGRAEPLGDDMATGGGRSVASESVPEGDGAAAAPTPPRAAAATQGGEEDDRDGEDGDTEQGDDTTTAAAASNAAPVAADASLTAGEDSAAEGTLEATDADNDSLTYSLLDGPAEGSVTINADGSYTFDPGQDFQDLGVGESREVTFTYQVSDGQGGTDTATATVTVTGSNDGPVAEDASISASEDGDAVTGQLSASDIDGDSLTFALVDGPAEGAVTVNADGSYSFTPGDDFQDLGVGESREVSFTYEVSDGQGGSDTATATITVTGSNDGPVAVDDLGSGGAGTVLASEDFAEGWSGEAGVEGDRMVLGQNETASKTFDFGPEHAGQTVVISFDSETFGTWDTGGGLKDTLRVSANGEEVLASSAKGGDSHSLTVTLDDQGRVSLDIEVDATGSDEGVRLDNLTIVGGDD
ncbi:cadherin-like domain-containing protein, partial [Roseospirillum parvum]